MRLLRWMRRASLERGAPADASGLAEVAEFGANPGELRMLLRAPALARAEAPLIVVLHGCRQHAATFAMQAGWFALADRIGAALLLPDQRGANNRMFCFNWFRAEDARRGTGEAASIRAMVAEALRRLGARPVFIAGLSAGGAMAAALLVAYPQALAGGAVIAGVPPGCAANMREGMARMKQAGPQLAPAEWAARLAALAPDGFAGPWPRLSIWHGGADRVVAPGNADILAAQWIGLNGLDPSGTTVEEHGVRRTGWGPALERVIIPAMGHGMPIDARVGGAAAPFVLDIGVPAAERIARFWGI